MFARVVNIIKYIKGAASFGLYLGGPSEVCPLNAFYDADGAACPTTRKSVTVYVAMYGIGAIEWMSARQATISRSCTESEYIAAGGVITWYRRHSYRSCDRALFHNRWSSKGTAVSPSACSST
jgi:hypothetical protein